MKQKVLWFISGPATAEQKAQARANGYLIRDAQQYHAGDFIEVCDAVMGDVPADYADKYPAFEVQENELRKEETGEDSKTAEANAEVTETMAAEDDIFEPEPQVDSEEKPRRGRPSKTVASNSDSE